MRAIKTLLLLLVAAVAYAGGSEVPNNQPQRFTNTFKADSSVYFKRGAATGKFWKCVNNSTGLGNWVTLPAVDTMWQDGDSIRFTQSGIAYSFYNPAGWSLTGNAGTTSANFIGTTDSKELLIKTNNTVRAYYRSDGTHVDSFYTSDSKPVKTYFGNSLWGIPNTKGYGGSYNGLGAYFGIGNLNTLGGIGDSVFVAGGKTLFMNFTGGLATLRARNAVWVGSSSVIQPATSYSNNVILGSNNCYMDSGSLNFIVGSFQCAAINTLSNPWRNTSHNVIISGYADTTHSYHEIAIGPGAVEKRVPYAVGGNSWDVRDLFISIGNNPNQYPNSSNEQSSFIMIKNGNTAIGPALDSNDIPTPAGAMLRVNGFMRIDDGTEGTGKTLVSDSVGNTSWRATAFTPGDSATIYALSPTPGTVYYCTDCSGNGVTGAVVTYFGAAWRRQMFE